MLARVSNIEAYRQWANWTPRFDGDEEPSLEDLIRFLTVDEPSPAMLAGTAFHKALELALDGEHATLEANGYKFRLDAGEIELPAIREMRAQGQYGALTVTGQVDGLHGRTVIDHKTTARVYPERYLDGCQWKFYLDLFDADVFRWYLFQIKEIGEREYTVAAPQELTAYRYPGLHDDCARLASDYFDFAKRFLPQEQPRLVQLLMAE